MAKQVQLEHPKLKENPPITVPESTARVLAKSGWKEPRQDAPNKQEAK